MNDLQNLESTAVKAFSIPHNAPPAVISDLEGVASYSWVDNQGVVSLAIPGSPRLWKEPRLPLQVATDSGTVFIDQNAARCDNLGTSPLTPLFLAVDEVSPSLDYKALDLVSDRNNLRKLLMWATGTMDKAFRIDVELVGTKTMVFSRCEEKTTETIPTGQFRGFGRKFKHVVTSEVDQYATGHHRVITYNLAELKVLLRFEVDACLPSVSDLADSLKGIGLSSTASASKTSQLNATTPSSSSSTTTSPISIQLTSTPLVAQDAILELKTMGQSKTVLWSRVYPELYISGAPHLYVARHSRGPFTTLQRYDLLGPTLSPHAKAVEQGLGKVVKSLRELSTYLQEAGTGIGFSLIGDVGGDLKLYRRKQGTGRELTKDIVARFT